MKTIDDLLRLPVGKELDNEIAFLRARLAGWRVERRVTPYNGNMRYVPFMPDGYTLRRYGAQTEANAWAMIAKCQPYEPYSTDVNVALRLLDGLDYVIQSSAGSYEVRYTRRGGSFHGSNLALLLVHYWLAAVQDGRVLVDSQGACV